MKILSISIIELSVKSLLAIARVQLKADSLCSPSMRTRKRIESDFIPCRLSKLIYRSLFPNFLDDFW
jgi:hypothetical protein